MTPDPDGFFAKAIDWAVGGLAVLVATVWGALHVRIGEIKKTADAAVPRVDFQRVEDRAAAAHALLRGDIKELSARDDALKDHINNKIDALRVDMYEQFTRISDKMDGRT